MGLPIEFLENGKEPALQIGDQKLTLHQGDLLQLKADALVCPVDPSLSFKSGLARIISQAAGKQIHKERPLVPEPYGKVVVLPGGKLQAKFIFLTVLYGERGIDKIRLSIRQSVDRTIRYAEFLRLKSLAFPVLGHPEALPDYNFVAQEMLENVVQYFQRRHTKLKTILFSAYNNEAYDSLRKEAKQLAD